MKHFFHRKSASLIFLYLFSTLANADMLSQKLFLEKLEIQYWTDNASTKRCLLWLPFQGAKKSADVQINEQYEATLTTTIQATIKGKCPVQFKPKSIVKEIPTPAEEGKKPDPNVKTYIVTILAPFTRLSVIGSNFEDSILFEAPVRELQDYTFFSFLKRSNLYIDTRYMRATTDKVDSKLKTIHMMPVIGGNAAVPLPYLNFLMVGAQAYQSLGNTFSNSGTEIRFSDLSISLRASYLGSESMGRPQLGTFAEYRRYSVIQPAGTSSLAVTAFSPLGAGFEGRWFPMAIKKPWHNPWSRLGFNTLFRYHPSKGAGLNTASGYTLENGLDYRLDRKWAAGVGYSYMKQNVISGKKSINEAFHSFFFRFTLIPFVGDF